MQGRRVIIANKGNVPVKRERHKDFAYDKYLIVPRSAANRCTAAIMEIPPGKAAYPYHYHLSVTEVFYIISGAGRLETPEGEWRVSPGDVIVFPAGESGAHKLWNASDSEPLTYFDCDTAESTDVAFYPHSGKVGVIMDGRSSMFFERGAEVDYYKGE